MLNPTGGGSFGKIRISTGSICAVCLADLMIEKKRSRYTWFEKVGLFANAPRLNEHGRMLPLLTFA